MSAIRIFLPTFRVVLASSVVVAIVVFYGVPDARAEPVLDRALQSARIIPRSGGCEILRIKFNFRVRYVSNFPLSAGPNVRIMVRAIDPAVAAEQVMTARESLRAPASKFAAITAIELDIDPAAGPVLVIQFAKSQHFEVAEGPDFESILIAISNGGAKGSCRPRISEPAGADWSTTISPEALPPTQAASAPDTKAPLLPPRSKARATGTLSDGDRRAAAAAMDEARAAIKKQNLREAMRLLLKVLSLPESEFSAEAQELMGLVRQRSGDLLEAQAEYEDYLARYPNGEGAERVRQRLAGVATASGKAVAQSEGASEHRKARPREDGTSVWTLSGSASEFYIRDDSFHTLRDPSLPPDLVNDPDEHRVHQNEMLSSLDLVGTYSNADAKWKFRFSGSEEHFFTTAEELVSVAALSAEVTVRDWNTLIRLGRQTRNTGGVLGRFDGGLVSWQATDRVGLNLIAGSPVLRRSDDPFRDERWFVGTSVDIGRVWEGLDVSLFAIEQRDRGVLDREAVGIETRYLTPFIAGFATVDYDIHFNQLNAAIGSATWTLADRSTIHVGGEYRKFPYLSAWNALQGQPFATLYDMLKAHALDEVEQFAVDRTASYWSASAGFAHPVNEHVQVLADVTTSEVSGMPASGGVGAMPGSGLEVYYSAQVVGNDLLTAGDMYIAGLRVADREDSNLYVVDLNSRFLVTPELRVGPRLRLGYREGDRTDLVEYSALPSLLVNYMLAHDINLEVEAGARWTDTTQGGVEDTETELFLTAGIRYDFQADGVIK